MPILWECPQCGKRYKLRDELAGKRVKCGCGESMEVPAPAAAPAEDDSPEEYPFADESDPPPMPPPNLPANAISATTAEPGPPLPPGPLQRNPEQVLRLVVAVAAMVFGVVMAAWWAGRFIHDPMSDGLLGVFRAPVKVLLAALIATGGVLIFKGNKHGPACAGLSCIVLCFFPAWFLLLAILTLFTKADFLGLLKVLALTVLVYAVPAGITVWCLREETARKKDLDEPY